MKLKDRVAIVTGAGSGIGKAIATALAGEGAAVGVADIDVDSAKAAARDIEARGGKSLAVQVDITKSSEVKAGVKTVLERFGKIDILVNNAGWDRPEPFIETTEETWDKVIAINLKGHIIFSRAVLDNMIERGYGKIVSISSDAGRNGSTGEVVYAGAKGGIIGFTKALAREMARYGINVYCVSPGPTDTPLFSELSRDNPRLGEALIKAIPLRRLGKPEDVAAAVVFLASDDASYITGQTLSVSGGLTMF
ncbi:MAG: 3-oxoacyl-ACP reductase FabG [Chloroflexi bacterium]|nr:3-oxoacyl-ACP reductase FabG [Chloroflexota bacterium]